MITPLLIIGIGGAGGKTIRAMKQELKRILESSGYTADIPSAWQFLHIDTTYDGVNFPAPMLPADEFHCVVPNGASYADILGSITGRCTKQEQQILLAGWGFPTPNIWDVENDHVLLADIERHEYSKRVPNRLLLLADSKVTLNRLQISISKMQAPTAMAELRDIAKTLGAELPKSAQPQALIISSLAGGTGSGMFMDVSELLKRATPAHWAQEAISFLYTPEVFDGLGSMSANLAKNTLGAFNELIASRWVGLSSQTELVYSKMGLAASSTKGQTEYGCRTNILLGAQDTTTGIDIRIGVDGAETNEVFRSIGQVLASAVSSDEISDFLIKNFAYTSWNHGAIDFSGLAPEASSVQNPSMTASGIGFGKLSLGVEHIVDYVADAMGRQQIEKLLWPELTPALFKGGITVRELIQEKADEIWPNFLPESGLDERGSQSQIVDALLPEQAQERVKQYVTGIIKKNVSATAKPLATFSRAIWSEWETESNDFLTTIKNEMSSKAQKWVPSIQERLRNQFSNELMLNGYAVLTNLTERLELELRDHAMPELLRDHNEFSSAISGFDQQVFNKRVNEIADGLTGVSTQNGPFLGKLSQSLSRVLEFQINSHVNTLAASLIQDMLSFFITPLKEQLADSRFTLHKAQKATLLPNGSKNPYMNYPDWASGVVPNRYKSRTIERILIDSDEYESTYDFYASKDSQGAPAFQQSVSSALLGKKMNPMPGDINPQTLISERSPWITSVRDAQGTMGAAVSKSEWNFHTDIAELSERNRRWLKNKDSAFGKFVNISIRDYVSANDFNLQVRSTREDKFISEFQALLKMAQPLITINPNAMQHVLSVSDGEPAAGVLLKTSKIPFDFNSRVGQVCAKILQQHGQNPSSPGFAINWFDPHNADQSILAMSTTISSLPAWAFASLTEPILEDVARSKNRVPTWSQFWSGRRSRPLVEAIPLENEMRRSIITGWFVATLFGMRKVEIVPGGRTVQIWNPTLGTPDWSTFPSPLLNSHPEDMKRDSWLLPQLLMSAGIALANFGNSGDPEFIYGYRLLKFLGREVTTSFPYRDYWDGNGAGDLLPNGAPSRSTYIRDWVNKGELPSSELKLSVTLDKILSNNPNRAEALKEYAEKLRSEYQAIWEKFANVEWYMLPETWELREDIDLALSDISAYAHGIKFPTGDIKNYD